MPDPEPRFTDADLARYLSGECSPADADAIRRWVDADPSRGELLQTMRSAWVTAERDPVGWDVVAMRRRLAERMDRPATRPPLRVVPPVRRRLLSRVLAAAAAMALVAGGGILGLRTLHLAPRTPVPMREVTTTRGQRAEVRLDDGSRVMLGVASRLRFPRAFGVSTREVELEGEAYFQVEHDTARPFLVRAGGTVTEDLGTEFSVKAYPNDTTVRVVVAEGAVAFGADTTSAAERVALAPRDLAVVGSAGTLTVFRDVDIDPYLSWTEGRLEFRRTPLRDVLHELTRWYAVDIRLPDSTRGGVLFTGSFTDASSNDVIDAVARSLNLTYRRTADTLWLLPKPAVSFSKSESIP